MHLKKYIYYLIVSYRNHKQKLPTRSIQLGDSYLPANHICKVGLILQFLYAEITDYFVSLLTTKNAQKKNENIKEENYFLNIHILE